MFKKIISYFFTFILIIMLLTTSVLLIAKSTVLDKEYVLSILDSTDYYNKTKQNIESAFGNYILQSGLEEDVIKDLYDDEKLKNDINSVIDSIYENKSLEIETGSIEEKLQERIDKVLEEHNKKLDRDEERAIEKFIKAITDSYITEVAYSTDMVAKISNIFNNQIKLLVSIGLITSIASLIVVLLIMLIINKSKILHYLGIMLLSTGILIDLIPIVIKTNININTLLILNSSFSEMGINLINNILKSTLITGTIMTILGIIVVIICSIFEKRKIEKVIEKN